MFREQTFAGIDALTPRVIEIRVAEIATLLEPSTATSATTELAGSLDGAALGARGTWFHRYPGGGDLAWGGGDLASNSATAQHVRGVVFLFNVGPTGLLAHDQASLYIRIFGGVEAGVTRQAGAVLVA